MPQALAHIAMHLVFSTKNRQHFLQAEDLRLRLYPYIAGILQSLDCQPILINGTADHLHLLFFLGRTVTVARLVGDTKSGATKWIHGQGTAYADFAWQAGYGIFSVSQSQVASVKVYIASQEEHHQQRSFQDEFRLLCQKHALALDERYAWD